MMVGLPSSGKSCWAQNHCRENPDKNFLILGRELIFDRLKVNTNIFLSLSYFKIISFIAKRKV